MNRFGKYFNNKDLETHSTPPKTSPRAIGLPDGEWVDDGVYAVTSSRPICSAHGSTQIGSPDSASIMREFGASGHIVFLDLETTGLAGGTGTYAFLCGIGFESGGMFVVRQLFLEGPSYESRWLDKIGAYIPQPSTLVTYNGAAFDIPLLRTRHVLSRSQPAWDSCPHIDLLRLTRKFYRHRLSSCSLGSIESNVLLLERSGEDIPGHMIPTMYTQYLRTRDAAPLAGIFYHNEIDIVSLAAMYCRIAKMLDGTTGDAQDAVRAGDIWYESGDVCRAGLFWSRACQDERVGTDALIRLAFMDKRASRHCDALVRFMDVLSRMDDLGRNFAGGCSFVDICVEIAKIMEHRMGDPTGAMRYVAAAYERAKRDRWKLGTSYREMMSELKRRYDRLAKKISMMRS